MNSIEQHYLFYHGQKIEQNKAPTAMGTNLAEQKLDYNQT